MLRPHGYIINGDIEKDTVQCSHCQRHYDIKPKENPSDAGGWCGRCMKPLCTRCAQKMSVTLKCVPFEQKLDQMEKEDISKRRYSGVC